MVGRGGHVTERTRERIRSEAVSLCETVAAAYGLEVDAVADEEYPLTVNDAAHAQFVADTVVEVLGEEHYQPMQVPLAGAEDFSRVLAAVPGCYLMLGASGEPDHLTAANNHSPRARFDDGVLHLGAQLHAELAVRALRRGAAFASTHSTQRALQAGS